MTVSLTAKSTLRPETRRALLDALECADPLSVRQAATRTALSTTTVRRAARKLSDEGILDPQAPGRLTPADTATIAILNVTTRQMGVHLLDGHLKRLASATTAYNPAISPEDNLHGLCQRAVTLATCRRDFPICPVLLLPDTSERGTAPPIAEDLTALARVAEGCGVAIETVRCFHAGEAIASELLHRPEISICRSLLYLYIGEEPHAALFCRENEPNTEAPRAWHPSPLGDPLSATLARHLIHTLPMADRQPAIARFLADCRAFIGFGGVMIEQDGGETFDRSLLGAGLPSSTWICLPEPPPHALTLSEQGAARMARRAIWEQGERR